MSSVSHGQSWPVQLRQNSLALFDQVLVSSASFLTTLIVGRFGSDHELGLLGLGTAVALTVASVLESVVCFPYIFRASRREPGTLADYTGSALLHTVLLSAVTTLALVGAILGGGDLMPSGLPSVLWVICFTIFFFLVRIFIRRHYLLQMDLRGLIAYDAIAFVVQAGVLAAAIGRGRVTGIAGQWSIGLSCAVVSIYWLWKERKTFSLTRHWQSHFSENWDFGKLVLAAQAFYALHNQILVWILAALHGTNLAGQFVASFSVVMLNNPFVLGLMNIVAPRVSHAFSEGGAPRVRQVVWENLKFMMAGVTAILILLVLLGAPILQFLFGQQYGGQQLTISLLAIAVFAEANCKTVEHGLLALDKPQFVAWVNVVRFVLTAVIALVLIPRYKVVGASAALAIADVAASGMMFVYFLRETSVPSVKSTASPTSQHHA